MTPSETAHKLPSPAPQGNAQRAVGIRWDATAIRSSAPPVQIVGSPRPYRGGGFRVNV